MADDYYAQIASDYDKESSAIQKQADALISEANGSYEYTAKWIEKEFERALGTDDTARQEFLKKVYSAVEEQIGRIPYDYQKYTERQLEDYATDTKRVNEDTELALKIADEDYNLLKEQQNLQQNQDRQTQAESLLSRGILTENRSQAGGIAGQAVGQLEKTIDLENTASQNEYERNKNQLITDRARQLEDLETTNSRTLADLTDTARRDAQDSQDSRDQGIEGAQLQRDQTIAQINRNKDQALINLNKEKLKSTQGNTSSGVTINLTGN